jgi:hypothetical protein
MVAQSREKQRHPSLTLGIARNAMQIVLRMGLCRIDVLVALTQDEFSCFAPRLTERQLPSAVCGPPSRALRAR